MTGPCLICSTIPRRLHADHCHRHDQQRGPICPRCNRLMSVIDSGRQPRVSAPELQALAEHAARCHGCAEGKPATAPCVYRSSLVVSDDLKEALQVWAKAHDRSVSSAIRIAIRALIEQDDQPKEIQR